MTTYSFIKYDVLKDIMYFKSTPTPDFKQLIKADGISTEQDREVIEGVQSTYNNLIPQDTSEYIKSYLEDIPELDLSKSNYITLKIEIFENNTVGTILIISQNTNRTLTTINVPTNDWPTQIASKLKPEVKYPVLGKCKNCLKFTFQKDNVFNFVGNLGGEWDGSFRNGQKVYRFFLPDYTFPSNGASTDYRIFWKPNITGAFPLYGGGTLNINNEAKWIAVPSASIGTVNELSNTTFFHALSNTSASCPFTPNPTNPNWNFQGNKGKFLLEIANTGITEFGVTKCPQFFPTPGNVDWGYNCGPNGCVQSPSGSVGTYATLAQCQVSCSIDPTQSFEYRCTINGCIPIPSGSGGYLTLAECEAKCITNPPNPPIEYVCNLEGNCIPAPSGSGGYPTLAECQASCSVPPPPPPVYEYVCTQNGCIQVPSGSGGFATIGECEAVCNPPLPTECNCSGNLVPISNPNFSQGLDSWTYSPNPVVPGVGGWSFVPNKARASVQEVFNSLNVSNTYLSQLNVLTVSCSYEICFQAWSGTPESTSSFVSIDTGNYTTNLPVVTTPLSTFPTAYTLVISNTQTPNLTFFVSSPGDKIFIDNICVKQIYCPPPTDPIVSPTSSLILTGSTYCYTDIEYDCTCPEGYVSNGSGSCIQNGFLTISASVGLYTPLTVTPSDLAGLNFTNTNVIPGFSVNQPSDPFAYNIPSDLGYVAGYIPALMGMAPPNLYYDWNFNGSGNSSTNNSSPFSGSSLVYNTQYTFDILKSNFWYQPDLGLVNTDGDQNWLSRWVFQLLRQTKAGLPWNNGTNNRWAGFGTTLDVPSNKTYYIGIIGQGATQIKIDGTTILCTSPSPTNIQPYTVNFPNSTHPAYTQNGLARYPTYPNGTYNWGVIPSPLYSLNPYITTPISSSYFNFYFQNPGPEYYFIDPSQVFASIGKFLSGYNLYIYPVTMSAGCHQINFESCPDYNQYCNNNQGGLGAIIFDMTAEQLVSASNYSDLNIVWDSTYLEPITSSFAGLSSDGPVYYTYYLYTYPVNTIPSSSSYLSWCPTGSTPVGGNPCNGCFTTESITTSVPCGNCVECTHGLLYNGYVVDAGGPTYTGRGAAGIVNINPSDNPINTWKIPENNDWYDLITFVNNSISPSSATPIGSYGVEVGGKLKDYTRDLIATCWEFPNAGAQTDDFSSGWNGVAGGTRNNVGTFSGLKLEGYWWTANSTLSSSPLKLAAVNLKHYSNEVYRDNLWKSYGCSIRLVRPVEPGEVSGDLILDAYTGNDGTKYNGIVFGNQVWITVNLSETKYNDGSDITFQSDPNIWDNTLTTAEKFSCYYNNQSVNVNLPTGNVDPITGLCYEYPKIYVYRKCDGSGFLAQTEPGPTITPGEVIRANDLVCWEFFAEYSSSPNIIFTEYYTGNYFDFNPTIYNSCEECNAIHTIYMTFNTKNC